MQRSAALRLLIASLLALAAHGCKGYSNGSFQRAEDASADAFRVPDAGSSPSTAPASNAKPPDAALPADDAAPPSMEPVEDATTPMLNPDAGMDAGAREEELDAGPAPDLRWMRTPRFDGYLTDGAGEPLYMFIGDIPGSDESACLDACASAWPPFDAVASRVSAELDRALVSRFHRQDGAWQITYKGYPLYRRASEAGKLEVTGDNVDGRWFVARDYLAFMRSARTFAPAGGSGTSGPFLTDGFGRTLYVCLDDTPATVLNAASSSCDGACLARRPAFSPSDVARPTDLPSSLDATQLQAFERTDGTRQFMYRGWPLYYFSGDAAVGATEGHNDGAWRAFDPVQFQQ